jgi:alpha-N-arabinofuranosidase
VLDLLVESSTYDVSGLDKVGHVDVAGSLDRGDGKLSLFILNRDLSKSHEVEVVWEDAAPARVIAASVLTGDDLKASNTFAAPKRVVPQAFAAPAVGGAKTKFEVPAHSYTVIQWAL